jgi:uncharacterized protein (UPF0335 family)
MTDNGNAPNGEQLRAFVTRFEKLDEDRKAIVEDQAELIKELKGSGFDGKIFKRLIALRKKSADARTEEAELLRLYGDALQMDLGF